MKLSGGLINIVKILHLASFIGNIGDNASHYGTYKILDSIFNFDYRVDTFEIRKTYANYNLKDKCCFDNDFAKLANCYDLLLIGGGCFLDFWVKDSATGTTLDISDEILREIRTPIAICSMGCLHRENVPRGNIRKLDRFLTCLMERNNTFVSIRNDSSLQVLQKVIGNKFAHTLPEVLDSAYFYENNGLSYRPVDSEYIIINFNYEQLSRNNLLIGDIDLLLFKAELLKVVNYIIDNTDYNIVFTAHVYADYGAMIDFLNDINDYHIRTRIAVTPYVQGSYGCEQIFSAYKNSSLVIGMRYHAVVCSISLGTPCVGIASTDRVLYTFESLGLNTSVLKADESFSASLIDQMNKILKKPLEARTNADLLNLKRKQTIEIYKDGFENIL